MCHPAAAAAASAPSRVSFARRGRRVEWDEWEKEVVGEGGEEEGWRKEERVRTLHYLCHPPPSPARFPPFGMPLAAPRPYATLSSPSPHLSCPLARNFPCSPPPRCSSTCCLSTRSPRAAPTLSTAFTYLCLTFPPFSTLRPPVLNIHSRSHRFRHLRPVEGRLITAGPVPVLRVGISLHRHRRESVPHARCGRRLCRCRCRCGEGEGEGSADGGRG
ncbi:hypothetical protein DFH06DRAFT_577959 [Mycena polygramma]|nr:hypothetical protein DFH06DRAFT_577959 [Mycena polygramma]